MNLWITLQAHANIVAVASMKGFAGILLVGGREPQEGTLEKAESERIPILVSELPAFELVSGSGARPRREAGRREGAPDGGEWTRKGATGRPKARV